MKAFFSAVISPLSGLVCLKYGSFRGLSQYCLLKTMIMLPNLNILDKMPANNWNDINKKKKVMMLLVA